MTLREKTSPRGVSIRSLPQNDRQGVCRTCRVSRSVWWGRAPPLREGFRRRGCSPSDSSGSSISRLPGPTCRRNVTGLPCSSAPEMPRTANQPAQADVDDPTPRANAHLSESGTATRSCSHGGTSPATAGYFFSFLLRLCFTRNFTIRLIRASGSGSANENCTDPLALHVLVNILWSLLVHRHSSMSPFSQGSTPHIL